MYSVPIVRGECLLKYHFRPQQEWQRSVGIFDLPVFGCWLEAAFPCESVLREGSSWASFEILIGGSAGVAAKLSAVF